MRNDYSFVWLIPFALYPGGYREALWPRRDLHPKSEAGRVCDASQICIWEHEPRGGDRADSARGESGRRSVREHTLCGPTTRGHLHQLPQARGGTPTTDLHTAMRITTVVMHYIAEVMTKLHLFFVNLLFHRCDRIAPKAFHCNLPIFYFILD